MEKTELVSALRREGFVVTEWSEEPNVAYGAHRHPHREVRVVLAGQITFAIGALERTLRAGDRIDVEPGEIHAARVGTEGVTYLAGRR
jgi:quercetin dioxygenase-like cupin family protein